MFAWVLILIAWVALLSLILHDVTRDETSGSAVLIAARKVRALIALAFTKARRSRRARARATARARAAKQAAIVTSPAETPSPEPVSPEPLPPEPVSPETASPEPASAEPISLAPAAPETPRHFAPEAIKLGVNASAPKKKWWRSQNDRAAKTIPEIESAIVEAVRSAAPDCRDFVGVIVRQKTPRSRQDVNWELQGVKFGKADKKRANDALHGIVKQMQREFRVTDQ
jgi:hypothetical protein